MLIVKYIFTVEIALWPQAGDSPPRPTSLSVDALTPSWPPEVAFPKSGSVSLPLLRPEMA